MSRKALKVLVELKFRAVSCPGVHLQDKEDIYLSMCFMGQYRQTDCLPAVFPLLFNEKITFEKIFRDAVDPGDIAVMLEYETVRIELVQLIPPVADTLAFFEEDARRFLFPEPKLVPSFSGVDREVLMTRATHFAGIAPRLEFSTKTTIIECSAKARTTFYPNVLMRPTMRTNRKPSSRPQTSSPQTPGKKHDGRTYKDTRDGSSPSSHVPRSQSPSPMRTARRLAQLSLASAAHTQTTSSSPHMMSSWPGASRSASTHRSAFFTNTHTPLTRSLSTVRYSPTDRRKYLSSGLNGETLDDFSSSQTHRLFGCRRSPESSGLRQSFREQGRHCRSLSSSHREWEEVQQRVRGLLTTPKAVRRLVYGASHSEVDEVLARRSISPGPL